MSYTGFDNEAHGPSCFNNLGNLIDGFCQNRSSGYNVIASWRYSELPHALGCDGWYTARATNCGELDQSLNAEGKTNGVYLGTVAISMRLRPCPRGCMKNGNAIPFVTRSQHP